jgi:hypothetical protein
MIRASLKAATVLAIALIVSIDAALAGTYTVTNTNDTGAGSFRQGILDANSATCTDPCTIVFDSGVFATTQTISLTAFPFPAIAANNVFIDGFSGGLVGSMNTNAFGASDNSVQRVVINGISNTCCPITVNGTNFQIRGVVLEDFLTALQIQNTGAVITGCKIGTNAAGTAAAGIPNVTGIQVTATGSATIGGTTPAERNLISGQSGPGIQLQSDANVVVGNYIGTNAAGTAAVPNGTGITIAGNGNAIGTAAMGNVISGNTTGRGIEVTSGTGTTISNNRIGTDITGSAAVPNGAGVFVGGGPSPDGAIIGGSGLANLISGNSGTAIEIGTSNGANSITFNVLGLNSALSATIPNGGSGVVLTGGGANNQIANNFIGGNGAYGISINGAADTTIQNNFIGFVSGTPRPNTLSGVRIAAATGTTTIQQNSIRNNGGVGVDVDGITIGVVIKQNQIADNTGIGIDLHNASGSLGATANDTGDADTGAGNHLQNFPAISSAVVNGPTGTATLTLNFTVDSSGVPTTGSLGVEAFMADTDPTNPEGFVSLGSQCYLGNTIAGTMTIPAAGVVPGDRVVLTATSYLGSTCLTVNEGTSEFSPAATVALIPGLVVNTNNAGTGSLRQAILDANSGACPSPCNITFNIPTSDPGFAGGVFTIQPTSPQLSVRASNTVIDGATQTAFSGDTNPLGPEIVVNGNLGIPTQAGFVIDAAGSGQGMNIRISNLVINGFAAHGISTTATTGNLPQNNIISGNYIGTDPTGTSAVPNGTAGWPDVRIFGINNQVGGSTPADRNVIGGGNGGVEINGTFGPSFPATSNLIIGNYIGVDRTGTAALGNTTGVIITGNVATNNVVGGSTPAERNVISGNGIGIDVVNGTSGNIVAGNFIGTDASGSAAIANGNGVTIGSGAFNNTIGGPSAAFSNTIAFNGGGVLVLPGAGTGNSIRRNSIHSNSALGIDLDTPGVTPNDAGDPDTGANNLQNFPILNLVTYNSGSNQTTISGTLNSTITDVFDIDFFANTVADGSGFGEGEIYIGTLSVSTDGTGNTPFSASFTGNYRPFFITATATRGGGPFDTSEFSAVRGNGPPVANPDPASTNEDTAVTTNVVANDTDPEGDALVITGNTNGTNGAVACAGASCTYTPNLNFFGTDSYTYTITDALGAGPVTATVTVTVNAVNDAPVATNDTATTAFNTPVTTPVTTNDTDVDGGPLTVSSFTQGANGSVGCTGGNCTYTPNVGFSGADSYTYVVSDGAGGVATGTVTVTVLASANNPPVANNDSATTLPGEPVVILVLANDMDPDGDPLAITSFTQGATGAVSCTSIRCTYKAGSSAGSDSFTYTISDGNGGFDTATVNISIVCPGGVSVTSPLDGQTDVPTSGNFAFSGRSSSYNVYMGPAGTGCSTLFGTTSRNSISYTGLEGGRQYEIRVEGLTPGCPTSSSSCVKFTTALTCTTAPPTALSPATGAVVTGPVTFTWTSIGAPDYTLFASQSGGPEQNLGTTSATSLTVSIPGSGPLSWYVVANNVPGCGPLRSTPVTFETCNPPATPLLAVVAEATSGQTITVSWTSVAAADYLLEVANNDSFSNAEQHRLSETSISFTYEVTTATPFFYRVAAISPCNPNLTSDFSIPGRAVMIPVPSPQTPSPGANAPAGSRKQIIVQVFVPGVPGQTLRFTATVDKPWMQVRPASGEIGPDGLTFDVILDPSDLTNGTFTGTLIVTLDDGQGAGGRQGGHAVTTASTPVSINLVTPVLPSSQTTPPDTAMIIPAVGHLDAADRWRSDVRIANVSSERQRYQVTLTPADPQQLAKQTVIEADAGTTVALDDVVRLWYGIGSLGESSAGMLEIRPLTSSTAPLQSDGVSTAKTTVVSSRTFNISPSSQGTLGQYIPGIPFANFIGKAAEGAAAQVLSLQQISQNSDYRTNVGFAEASGNPVSLLLTVFDVAGNQLKQIPLDLGSHEQRQINSFLAQQNLTLNDGRIQVQVVGGEGKVMAYASVIDNRSRDQLFAPAITLGQLLSSRYVMPGVADLNTGLALWRSDLRIFNGGSQPQPATVTFYPQNNSGSPSTADITINPGEVKVLDDVLRSLFSLSNLGGAIHVTTPADSSLAVTGRTYNQTQNGTLGQFIPAVTPAEAIGRDEGELNLVQLEDSVRLRTNIGLAETTGNGATVELTINLPESKVAPRVQIPLGANEFRQIAVLRELGIGNVYNARISVRVIDGQGRVTAYGSLIDLKTQDSTYIPAQ